MHINRCTAAEEHSEPVQTKELSMKALSDLFSTDYGLMSISGIAFMLGMGVFFVRYFSRKMEEDARAAAGK
jgi:Protein of unknown function (DUF3149)